VPPAVAPGLEVRRPAAPIGLESGWHFDDGQSGERTAYRHLAGKFHAQRLTRVCGPRRL
jgi:hypothetical protein